MRFILFDSVIARECHIRRGWARRRTIGLRLFWWQLVFSLLTTTGLLVLLAVPALLIWRLGWFTFPREHILGLVLAGVALFLLLFLIIAVVAVIRVMTKDFVVPQMALENIGAMEGWRRLLTRVQQEKVGYAGYIGMKLVLAIAAAIIFGIITFVVLLLVLIPVGGFGLVAVLGGKAAGLSWNVFTIAAAVMAAVWVLAILVAIVSLIYVPAMVFFQPTPFIFSPRATRRWQIFCGRCLPQRHRHHHKHRQHPRIRFLQEQDLCHQNRQPDARREIANPHPSQETRR